MHSSLPVPHVLAHRHMPPCFGTLSWACRPADFHCLCRACLACWAALLACAAACTDSQNSVPTTKVMQADEELLLLEAIDMSGLGNWAAVAEHVGTKSKEVCKVCVIACTLSRQSYCRDVA